MKRLNIILFLYIFTLATAWHPIGQAAAEGKKQLPENASLNDYLAYAALNNPGLEAAFMNWKAALERVPQVQTLPDPRFTFAVFIREVETRVGPQQAKVGIMQMFPWFGKLKLKGNAAMQMAHAYKEQYEQTKLNLFYQVKEAFYEYYYVNHAITVIKENIELLDFLEENIRMRYRTGKASHSSLVKIQVELDKLLDRLTSMTEMVLPVQARLNAAMNRPTRAELTPPKYVPQAVKGIEIVQLKQLLTAHNPTLKAIGFMAGKEEIVRRLARKAYYPDFSIGLDYMLTGDARMPGVANSGKDPLAAMVSVNIPIHFKKIKASIREAGYRKNAALKNKEDRQNRLLAKLETVFYRFRDSGRQLLLYKDGLLPRAKQALEVTHAAFESGKMDFMNLIDSQRMLLGFQLAYERALATHHQRLAQLEKMVGKELAK